jgi:hypothetical protein
VSDGGWRAIALDDVEAVAWRGTELVWRPVRGAIGTRIVGMAAYTAERAGQEVVEAHTEAPDGRGHEEVYVVLRGRATFTLDGEALDAPTGTFVRVDAHVHRHAVAAEPGTAVLALGGDPVFEPAGGEWVDRARPYLRSDPARAAAILDELEAFRPGSAALPLGRALLARAQGDLETARAQLREALRREPRIAHIEGLEPDIVALLAETGLG